MGFKCGIVGLPNVGKSTLFNAVTKSSIQAENYPFCTIEPNVGIVPVPDKRLDNIAAIVNPERVLPTTMEFVDIAGLVKGASKGEGLGNKFLANIREVDAIAHVVRCFDDENVTHVDGNVDPLADIGTINTELMFADLESVEKALYKTSKLAKTNNKAAVNDLKILEQIKSQLEKGLPVRSLDLDLTELSITLQLLTSKPVMYIANVSEAEINSSANKYVQAVTTFAAQEDNSVVTICAAIEADIATLETDAEVLEFLEDLGLTEPGLNRVIRLGYKLLDLKTFFTAGVKEVRAWTTKIDDCAPQAAGKIHGDFERGFIKAEVIALDDFLSCNGEAGAKEAGKLRTEGKDYLVCDGDIMHFRFNV